MVTPEEIHDLEPNIKTYLSWRCFIISMVDMLEIQKKILLKLYELFLKKGGKFLKMNIKDINFNGEKPLIKAETQSFLFDKIVIACGSFSKKLTDNLEEKNTS